MIKYFEPFRPVEEAKQTWFVLREYVPGHNYGISITQNK